MADGCWLLVAGRWCYEARGLVEMCEQWPVERRVQRFTERRGLEKAAGGEARSRAAGEALPIDDIASCREE